MNLGVLLVRWIGNNVSCPHARQLIVVPKDMYMYDTVGELTQIIHVVRKLQSFICLKRVFMT